jgi:hypothetical protein
MNKHYEYAKTAYGFDICYIRTVKGDKLDYSCTGLYTIFVYKDETVVTAEKDNGEEYSDMSVCPSDFIEDVDDKSWQDYDLINIISILQGAK